MAERQFENVVDNKQGTSQGSKDRGAHELAFGTQPGALDRLVPRAPDGVGAQAHASATNRALASPSPRAPHSLLRLQRQYGNRYVQRVLARASQEGEGAEVSPEVESSIERARGGGQALDAGVRVQMESAFGADFGAVRAHTDTEAHSLNQAVNAVAFTTGKDIFFREGAYSPSTSGGRELLAHELTHVVQQNGSHVRAKLVVGEPGDQSEQEADRVGKEVAAKLDGADTAHGGSSPSPGPAAPVQRQCACGGNASSGGECEGCRKKRESALGGSAPPGNAFRGGAREDPGDGTELVGGARGSIDYGPQTTSSSGRDFNEPPVAPAAHFGGAATMLGGDGDGGAPDGSNASTDAGDSTLTGGAAPTVTTSTVSGPTFNGCDTLPRFVWCVNFTTSLRNGFIVQRIDNVFNAQNCDGTPAAGPKPTPKYWEAWSVDGTGNVTPVDVCGGNDRWQRFFCSPSIAGAPCNGNGTQGNWSMTGTTFAVTTLPAGFAAHAVPDAGILQSTTTDPGAALGTALGTRTIGGTWNCCPMPPGAAGPPNNFHNQS